MVIVSPRMQARGTGRRLLREVLSAAGERTIRLVATVAGRRLYELEGFRATGTITQHQGMADATAATDDPRVRPATEADWPSIASLDREAVGGNRGRLLKILRRVGRTCVMDEGGRVAGFSVCRPFGHGHVIGPLVATNLGAAIALASPHVRAHAGAFLRLDTPQQDGPLVPFAEACGLRNVDQGAQMTRGTPPGTGPAQVFALASQAFG
jgi:predicted N-acetyltransferase YhbS